jgi:hypothetical protein
VSKSLACFVVPRLGFSSRRADGPTHEPKIFMTCDGQGAVIEFREYTITVIGVPGSYMRVAERLPHNIWIQ